MCVCDEGEEKFFFRRVCCGEHSYRFEKGQSLICRLNVWRPFRYCFWGDIPSGRLAVMLSEEKLRDIADWVGASFDVLLSHELEAANELLRECNGLFGEHSVRYADSCSGLFYETFSELPSVEPVFVTCPNQLWDALQPYASKQIRELVARKTMADMVLRCEEMHFHCVLAVCKLPYCLRGVGF